MGQEEKEEISQLFVTVLMIPVISDYVPSLNFLTKLQGKERLLKDHCDEILRVVGKVTELEKHRAKERALRGSQEDYVADFVDMITAAPLDDGKPLPDRRISMLLLVRYSAFGHFEKH